MFAELASLRRLFRERRENPLVVYNHPRRRGAFRRIYFAMLRYLCIFAIPLCMIALATEVFYVGNWLELVALTLWIYIPGLTGIFLIFTSAIDGKEKSEDLYFTGMTPKEIIFGLCYWGTVACLYALGAAAQFILFCIAINFASFITDMKWGHIDYWDLILFTIAVVPYMILTYSLTIRGWINAARWRWLLFFRVPFQTAPMVILWMVGFATLEGFGIIGSSYSREFRVVATCLTIAFCLIYACWTMHRIAITADERILGLAQPQGLFRRNWYAREKASRGAFMRYRPGVQAFRSSWRRGAPQAFMIALLCQGVAYYFRSQKEWSDELYPFINLGVIPVSVALTLFERMRMSGSWELPIISGRIIPSVAYYSFIPMLMSGIAMGYWFVMTESSKFGSLAAELLPVLLIGLYLLLMAGWLAVTSVLIMATRKGRGILMIIFSAACLSAGIIGSHEFDVPFFWSWLSFGISLSFLMLPGWFAERLCREELAAVPAGHLSTDKSAATGATEIIPDGWFGKG